MPNPKDDKTYSTNQVAALVEDLRSDFRAVIEVVTPLTDRMEKVEGRLSSLEVKVESLDDAIRLSVLPRLSKLEAKVG